LLEHGIHGELVLQGISTEKRGENEKLGVLEGFLKWNRGSNSKEVSKDTVDFEYDKKRRRLMGWKDWME